MSAFTGHRPGSPAYRRLLTALFFAGVATFAQLYAPQPLLPQISAGLAVAPATAALVVSVSTLGIAAAVIPWSFVADRIGRVRAMAVGIAAASILGVLAPLCTEIGGLLAVRLLEGVALGALPAVALAYLSEEIDARWTAAAAGAYIAGTTVGGLSGRLVAGPVGEFGDWRVGLWATAALCVVAAVLFLVLAPASQGFRPGSATTTRADIAARIGVNLRSGRQLALYAQGFLLMGAFVAMYNYLGFHLMEPPIGLPQWVVTLLFLTYLAGTFSSPWAGVLASRHGRYPVLLGSIAVMALGTALTLVPSALAVLGALLLFTAGFFGAHAIASGWTPVAARPDTRAQASSLYYLGYYGGSSLFGWCLGYVFGGLGWGWFVAAVIALCAVSGAIAAVGLRRGVPA